VRHERLGFDVANRHRGDLTTALHHPENRRLVRVLRGTAALVAATLATDVGFVHLDFAAERLIVLNH
jgi:hypothetical protein